MTAAPTNSAIRVFISYAHESKTHAEWVLQLANRLRKDGINCVIDQYEAFPPEGWPIWCLHRIQEADFVLVVCTQIYLARFEKRDFQGSGVKWEGHIMTQELYDSESINRKFVPIVFDKDDINHCPMPLRGTTHLVLPPLNRTLGSCH